MTKHITLFDTTAEYNNANLDLPNVSYTLDDLKVHYNPYHDYSQDYLTFEAIEDAQFKFNSLWTDGSSRTTRNSLQYSLNNGQTWSTLTPSSSGVTPNTPVIHAGEKILWKLTGLTPTDYGIGKFVPTGKYKVYGNIMSLYYGDNFADKTDLTGKDYAFTSIFAGDDTSNSTKLINAYNLILPATTLSQGCYEYMFYSCHNLEGVPKLPALTLVLGCYYCMFNGCSKVNEITCLATSISASNCTANWVLSVAASGTFIKNSSISSWTTGASGIPSGWTTQNAS